jgi:hypothetical protein
MIQTPVSVTDHQIAILQSLANSGIRQFAAGGKARAYGDIAGQEIGEAEQAQVFWRGFRAIRKEQAGSSDLGRIFRTDTLTRRFHPGTTALIWVEFSNYLGRIFRRLEHTPAQDTILPAQQTPKAVEAGTERLKVVTTAGGQAIGLGLPLSAVSFSASSRNGKCTRLTKVCSTRSFSVCQRVQHTIRPGQSVRIGPRPPVPDHSSQLAQFQSADKKIPVRKRRTRRTEHDERESNARIQTLRRRGRLRWQQPKVVGFLRKMRKMAILKNADTIGSSAATGAGGANGADRRWWIVESRGTESCRFEKRGYYQIDSAAAAAPRGASMSMSEEHPSLAEALPEAAREGGYTN